MKNFFFVDDSGSKLWVTPYAREFVDNAPPHNDENIHFWRNNYFVLAGIHVNQSTITKLNPVINQKKIDVFGTKHVEIKSEWFRNPHKRKKYYLDPFGISEEDLTDYMENFVYPLFEENAKDICIQAFVLDKRYYGGKRAVATPLQLLTLTLFDRVETHPSENCLIVFDQMESELKSKKGEHGDILRISKKEFPLESFHAKYTHAEVRFEKSCNSNFLQLADIAAHNVWRQFVQHGDSWDERGSKLPMYPYFKKISQNIYRNCDGKVAGFGIVKVPNPIGVPWCAM